MYGHKMAMRTYIQSLKALSHKVVILAFLVPGDRFDTEDLDTKTYYLPLPSRWTILANVIKYWLPKRKSINECLYLEESTFQRVNEICQTHGIELVVADMVRTAAYAEATGVPWILDHDDLLSLRYRIWTKSSARKENILGYLSGYLPDFIRPSIRRVFRMMLKREAALLTRREVYWSDKALCSSLHSPSEVADLASRTERRVFCMPLTVAVPTNPADKLSDRPISAVFTGGLTYQPNLDALRGYIENVLPAFARLGVEPPQLSVIGLCPDSLKAQLAHPTIRFLGYVPDILEELKSYQVFFAPIVSGSGVKTKVLEAMACGLPVIALPDAVSGISAEHMKHCLIARDPEEFVRCYHLVNGNTTFAQQVGLAARELVIRSYSMQAATKVLASELALVVSAMGRDRQLHTVSSVTSEAQSTAYTVIKAALPIDECPDFLGRRS